MSKVLAVCVEKYSNEKDFQIKLGQRLHGGWTLHDWKIVVPAARYTEIVYVAVYIYYETA